jgi:hypothetical protein
MSTDNVYADLGYGNADEMLTKAKLAAPRSRSNGRLSVVFI